jgi:F-box and WD-40 domain protein CDC4
LNIHLIIIFSKQTCGAIGHKDKVYCVLFFQNSSTIISGSNDWTLRIWNTETGACQQILTGHTDGIYKIVAIDKFIVSAAADKTVRIWDSDTGHSLHELHQSGYITTLSLNPYHALLAAATDTGQIKIWSVIHGRVSIL